MLVGLPAVHQVQLCTELQVAGEELQPPRPLPWYPRKLAWQMDASRAQLRKLDALAAVRASMVLTTHLAEQAANERRASV